MSEPAKPEQITEDNKFRYDPMAKPDVTDPDVNPRIGKLTDETGEQLLEGALRYDQLSNGQ